MGAQRSMKKNMSFLASANPNNPNNNSAINYNSSFTYQNYPLG